MDFVCVECEHMQPAHGPCEKCGDEGVQDLRKPETLIFLQDLRTRALDRREAVLRWVGVGCGIVLVLGMWAIPGFWGLRRRFFAIPFLFDQWALMGATAYGIGLLLDKLLPNHAPYAFVDKLVEQSFKTPDPQAP